MFSVFANIRIHTPERLARLQVCLTHLARVSAHRWVFNLRGDCKGQAAQMIHDMGLAPLYIAHLESEAGWSADTLELLREVSSEFIVSAVEDHILVANPLILEGMVTDMHALALDHMEYSWFSPKRAYDTVRGIPIVEGRFITGFELNQHTNVLRHQNFAQGLNYHGSVYGVSLVSIMRADLLRKICRSYQEERRRFDRHTPFDAERSGFDVDMFPIRTGQPKIELFAALDDDNIVPGSALQNRAIYRDLSSRAQVNQQEAGHNWLYRDLQFLVPHALTQRPDCTVTLRIYRYVPRLLELQDNLSCIARAYIAVLAEAFRLDPTTTTLVDYESESGCVSVFFLKVFGGRWCHYRSADDLPAVRAHENLFANRIFAGLKVEYLEQRVSIGEPTVHEGLRAYADYLPFGPYGHDTGPVHGPAPMAPNLPAAGGRLIYVDLTNFSHPALYARLRADLGSEDVRVVISEAVRADDEGWPEPATALNQWLAEHGFMLQIIHDFEVPATESTATRLLRRCAVYLR
jgi:hypothetical protein